MGKMGRAALGVAGMIGILVYAASLGASVGRAAGTDAPDYAGGSLTVLGLIRDGKYEDAYAYFSDEASKMLKPRQLGDVWRGLEEKGGPFQGFGTPAVSVVDKYHAVSVQARFMRMQYTFLLSWDEEGALAGLRITDMKEVGQGSPSPVVAPPASPPPPASPSAPPSSAAQAPATQTPAAAAMPAPAAASGFEGHWEGEVTLPSGSLPLRLDFARKDTTWTGTLDSPQQGANGLPLADIRVNGDEIAFGSNAIPGNARFTARLENGKLTGTLSQSGMDLPLHFSREKLPEPSRPQEPKPPFPYRDETVTYPNGDIRLEGTLTIPEGKGPFPAALLITGSGPQNRNEELFGHKPFLLIADYLTRAGIAVLRMDDRGVGGSTGKGTHPTSADFAEDVEKGIEFLSARPEIDPKRIGLIGHSEGGLIASIVGSGPAPVAYIVMLAGPGVPGDQILERQFELISRANGAPPDSLAKMMAGEREMLALIKSGADSASIRESLWKMSAAEMPGTDGGKALTAEQKAQQRAQVDQMVNMQASNLATPWFRYFVSTDPRAFLRKVKVPVLALDGEKDLQVDPDQNLPEIQKALVEGGNKDVTTRKLPGLNHLFQTAKTGSPNEYGAIEETCSPQALETMRDWILQRFGNR